MRSARKKCSTTSNSMWTTSTTWASARCENNKIWQYGRQAMENGGTQTQCAQQSRIEIQSSWHFVSDAKRRVKNPLFHQCEVTASNCGEHVSISCTSWNHVRAFRNREGSKTQLATPPEKTWSLRQLDFERSCQRGLHQPWRKQNERKKLFRDTPTYLSSSPSQVSICQGPATMITQPWPDALALEWTLKSTGFDSVELRNAALKNWLRTWMFWGKDVLFWPVWGRDNFVCPSFTPMWYSV